MGLKSGSRDAGLDESEDDRDQQADAVEQRSRDDADANESTAEERGDERRAVDERRDDVTPTRAGGDTASRSDSEVKSETGSTSHTDSEQRRPTMESIPYKLRRQKVNEGREQVPYFLREEVLEAEDDLQATLEERLGEDVYKSDYREAAMIVAQRHPELIADVLREWGYDLDAV